MKGDTLKNTYKSFLRLLRNFQSKHVIERALYMRPRCLKQVKLISSETASANKKKYALP